MSERWSRSISELGITPIFPPREDVYVGDIYVSAEPMHGPRSDGVFGNRATRWTSIPLGRILAWDSIRRPRLPQFTSEQRFMPTDAEPPAIGESSLGVPHFDSSHPLRLVAFPEFTASTVGLAEASAIIPSEALQVNLGMSINHVNSVGLKIGEAYSYAIPALFVLRELVVNRDAYERKRLAWGTNALGIDERPLGGPLQVQIPGLDLIAERRVRAIKSGEMLTDWEPNRGFFQTPAQSDGTRIEYAPVYVTVITEVFYARSVDVSLFDQTAGGGRASVSTTNLADPVDPTESRITTQAIEEANDRLAELSRRSGSGVDVRIVGASSRSVVLRRNYPRPVAIGYRGFTLEVDPMSGIVNYITETRSIWPLQGGSGKEVSSLWIDREEVPSTWNTLSPSDSESRPPSGTGEP